MHVLKYECSLAIESPSVRLVASSMYDPICVVVQYIMEILKKGDSMEFFLEGGRTRTGRAIIPKGGLLSVVVDACTDGECT